MKQLSIVVLHLSLAHSAFAHETAWIRYQFDRSPKFEASASNITPDTPFAIASVGKTITSVAILQEVEVGRLDLDREAQQWLPNEVVSGLGGMDDITLRHLLNMTSGLPDYYTDEYVEAIAEYGDEVRTPAIAASYAFDEEILFSPAEDFDYSNTNSLLLGMILENVSGKSYGEILQERIFTPAKMTNSFVFGTKNLPDAFPAGHEDGEHVREYYQGQGFGDGGVIASAADLQRFYHALFVEKTLLSEVSLEELLKDPLGVNYGMGIEVESEIYGHSGGDLGFASDIRFDAESGVTYIELIADGDADASWTEDQMSED